METCLKTGFAQIFSCCPKKLSCPKFGGAAAPLAPPARTPMFGTACKHLVQTLNYDILICSVYLINKFGIWINICQRLESPAHTQ